ncbi:MAG: hypothetical protein RLN88_09255 [Ekhidna sp.]|uniref:hypothetical protein n=1 Tax=Ekhidna sp. TaxID=2608089 RepID=UPI0032EF1742
MLKRNLHIILALALVFTTTGTIWSQLLADIEDPIEISTEKEADGEKSEKETEKELDGWDDDLVSEAYNIVPDLNCGFQKVGSSSYAVIKKDSEKLYILYQKLKLDC